MVPQFKKVKGAITFFLQTEFPRNDKESNWLPELNGPSSMVDASMLPKEELLKSTKN